MSKKLVKRKIDLADLPPLTKKQKAERRHRLFARRRDRYGPKQSWVGATAIPGP